MSENVDEETQDDSTNQDANELSVENDHSSSKEATSAMENVEEAHESKVTEMEYGEDGKITTREHTEGLQTDSPSLSSMSLIIAAIRSIGSSKHARRMTDLDDACKTAVEAIEAASPSFPSSSIVIRPLELACATQNSNLVATALDCLSKLISYSFLGKSDIKDTEIESEPQSKTVDAETEPNLNESGELNSNVTPHNSHSSKKKSGKNYMMNRVIDIICGCFQGESTDELVELQIVKALVAAVLSDKIFLHGTSLIKSIRMTYNVFLFSRSTTNQTLAQGALMQMVDIVFERVKNRVVKRQTLEIADQKHSQSVQDLTLESFEHRKSLEETRLTDHDSSNYIGEDAAFVLDASNIFKIICKLSDRKGVELDFKSHQMRSKLISLHLIYSVLRSHMAVFTSPDVTLRSESILFIEAIKPYLVVALSRNGTSPFSPIYSVVYQIFYELITNLRNLMKKEIELFFHEQYLPLLEMNNVSSEQKQSLLNLFYRLFADPRAIVEIYLNYDCDTSVDNIFEHLVNDISNMVKKKVLSVQKEPYAAQHSNFMSMPKYGIVPPNLSTSSSMSLRDDSHSVTTAVLNLRQSALECIVTLLRSLVNWTQEGINAKVTLQDINGHTESDNAPTSDLSASQTILKSESSLHDPSELMNTKQRKKLLLEGIKDFNYKPRRGISSLVENGLIESLDPTHIAKFLLNADGINKTTLGEFLGSAEPEDIAAMHAFVDCIDFKDLSIVSAIRRFLQTFRLPGEAQKIDRLMLKFAERYVEMNPGVFANADTAYILSYSIIMLNTDAHNSQVKQKMTKQAFFKNNRGINDGNDLPDEFLEKIYDEIQISEIILLSEHSILQALPQPQGFAAGFGAALATLGRDLPREVSLIISEDISNRTEARFKDILQDKTTAIFYTASHFEHVGPMFEAVWMPILAALSGTLQESDDTKNVEICCEAFRLAIHIACIFDLELARNAFVSSLAKFTVLNNLSAMKSKNVEAVKTLLTVAVDEGNYLKSSWKDILICVSQLERLQLLSAGIDENTLPDVSNVKIHRDSSEKSRQSSQFSRFRSRAHSIPITFSKDVGEMSQSREIIIATDKIFSQSATLNGEGIVYFVRALSEISWDEIQSSGSSEHPRMFSLQKLVDTCYYNMGRIRVEWSQIWIILGEHFHHVGCHSNASVVFFALDSLRQLSMRFLEIDELPHFRFQKDFLRPFEHIMLNTSSIKVKDMVLRCIQQMVLLRVENIKSGWRTVFGVFKIAAKEKYEEFVAFVLDNLKHIYHNHYIDVVNQGSFGDLVQCFVELANNESYQKISLQAIELHKGLITRIIEKDLSKSNLNDANNNVQYKLWLPLLQGFYEVVMNGKDMEVRSRALGFLFETLTNHGNSFSLEFWGYICRSILFPMFTVLKSRHEDTNTNEESTSVWLSTTMIQALRNLIGLFGHFFEILENLLDGLLDLLITCICQENDTLARIGTSCLQQIILENVNKFHAQHWKSVVGAFGQLFETTTAHNLFTITEEFPIKDDQSRLSIDDNPEKANALIMEDRDKKAEFKQMTVKCVLQILMIDTVGELFGSEDVYAMIPADDLLNLLGTLEKSFQFARKFNANRQLRINLWKIGFMKQLPNLLKQQSSSSGTCLNFLLRMYHDMSDDRQRIRSAIEAKLIPLCDDIVRSYVDMEHDSQGRNISALRHVVVDVLLGFTQFDEKDFAMHSERFFNYGILLMNAELGSELRKAVQLMHERFRDTIFKGKSKDRM